MLDKLIKHCKSLFQLRLAPTSLIMTDKFLQEPELREMTKDQLISKVLHYQNRNQQLVNQCKALQSVERTTKKRKRERLIDFKECNYRRIALKMAYFGWDYRGLQSNPDIDDTIEAILRKAIRRARLAAEDDPLKFSRSGRTDKGVSAFQQVLTVRVRTRLTTGAGVTAWIDPSSMPIDDRQAEHISDLQDHFKPNLTTTCDKEHSTSLASDENSNDVTEEDDFDFVLLINRNLPPEIRILSWLPVVDETFSARHNCTGREYRYFFPRGNLDIPAMRSASKRFCGLHDFRNFGKISSDKIPCFTRRIDEFDVIVDESSSGPFQICQARIKGSGFVYHQVRNMMAVLYLVGAGLEKESVITSLLNVEENERKPSYVLADPEPLVLYKTYYDDMQWRLSTEAGRLLARHLHHYWCQSAVRSTMAFELLNLFEIDRSDARTHDADQDSDDPRHPVHGHLKMSGFSQRSKKSYRKILDLPRGKTVEEKRESINAKRIRLSGKDDLVISDKGMTSS